MMGRADAVPGLTFHGHVASLAPATGAQFSVIPPENATGNFTKIVQRVPVRIVLDDDGAELGELRPGLSVVVRVDERRKTGDRVDERQGTPAHNEELQGPRGHDDEPQGSPVPDARR
jgi:multidrug resistance efflux pump